MAKQTFTTGQVLTAAQMTSLQQTAMLGGAASAKTASYTLVATDAGTAISMSSASATTITVNTALFAAGDTVQITNLGAGVCTITAGTATVNSSASLALAQYESGTLDFTSTSAAIFIKGAGAAAASGGMTLISEEVASNLSSLSFTSLGSYKQLYLWWNGIKHSTTGSNFTIRFNADSTGGNYQVNGFEQKGSTVGGTVLGNQGAVYTTTNNSPFGVDADSADTFKHVNGYLIIDNYTSSTKFKSYRGQTAFNNTSLSEYAACIYNGFYLSTSAITSIDITRLTGSATFSNITNSTIRLYGIS